MPEFTSSDGLKLHYEDDGEGVPILCLAGLTRNSTDFEYLLPHLPEHRVIRPDYRGRGKSDYDPDFMNYNILREGLDAIELLDHLELPEAVVIGTSRGGLIAMMLSQEHADRMTGVVLNDIGPEVAPSGLERIMAYVGRTPELPDLKAAAEALKLGHEDDFPDVPLGRWRQQAEFMWSEKDGGGLALRYDAKLRDALIGQAGAGEVPDLWTLFDGLENHNLATIRGENSDLLSAETLAKMEDRHPGMITATIPDRGHVPFLDEPRALAAITALLERCR